MEMITEEYLIGGLFLAILTLLISLIAHTIRYFVKKKKFTLIDVLYSPFEAIGTTFGMIIAKIL